MLLSTPALLAEQWHMEGAGRSQAAAAPDHPQFSHAAAVATRRVVKLYGGSIGREQGYGSGVLVGPDGLILTTASVLLETPALRVVLADGGRYPARIVARDEGRQLVLLRIDAADLPYFELGDSTRLKTGDWLIAAANPFCVAEGDEPVSISVGMLAGRTQLDGRRRAQDFPYRGPVLLTDMIVATPGSSGGAVVDPQGRLVGVIGRAVIGSRTNTWLNYAIPADEIAEFLAGRPRDGASVSDEDESGVDAAALGITLFDVGGRVRPAYVERVRPGSAAVEAGLLPGDLILSLDGRMTNTCAEFRAAVSAMRAGETAVLAVKRGELMLSLTLTAPWAEGE